MKDFKQKVQELLSQKGEELFSIMSKEALSEYELYEKAIKKQDISNARLHWEDFTKKFDIISNTLLRAVKKREMQRCFMILSVQNVMLK